MTEEERAVTTVNLFLWRYQELVEKEQKLEALESWGVDNWEGYDDAMRSIVQLPEPPRNKFIR